MRRLENCNLQFFARPHDFSGEITPQLRAGPG